MDSYNRLLKDLFVAYYDARRHKRNTINQLRFEIDYESSLIKLCDDIVNRRYTISPSICFIVDKPVKREIFAAHFRDRVVHHLVFNYINPFYEQLFIEDSYSCRKSKGTHYAVKRIESFMRECSENYTTDCYILKLDILGYFMNINKVLLKLMVENFLSEIEDKKLSVDKGLLLYLIKCILDDDPVEKCIIKGDKSDWNGLPQSKSLFYAPKGRGLPIGNLTSQLFSNVFLHTLDNYVKNDLKMTYYGRYVDDFVIIHKDKEHLIQIKNAIAEFVRDKLFLAIHPKKIYLQHYSKGVCFLGAIIKPHRIYVSKRTKQNFGQCVDKWEKCLQKHDPNRAELQNMVSSVNSYLGIMKHYRTYNVRKGVLLNQKKKLKLFRYGYLQTKPYKQMKYIIKKEALVHANC